MALDVWLVFRRLPGTSAVTPPQYRAIPDYCWVLALTTCSVFKLSCRYLTTLENFSSPPTCMISRRSDAWTDAKSLGAVAAWSRGNQCLHAGCTFCLVHIRLLVVGTDRDSAAGDLMCSRCRRGDSLCSMSYTLLAQLC